MSEVKHTPTPWTIEQNSLFGVDDGYTVHIADIDFNEDDNEFSKENAAHIVKCVNMHDELVDVLSGLMKVYNEPDETICCNGHHCGCQGVSVRQLAEHYARETLKKAGAL